MNKDRTIQNAITRLHIAIIEAMHAATMTDMLPALEAEECLDKLEEIEAHMADLRPCIGSRAKAIDSSHRAEPAFSYTE